METPKDYFVHPSSYVDEGAQIGKGTKVWHFTHIQQGAVVGENCSLGQNVNIANHVKIGNGVRIQNNVSVYEGVELEDNVFCGPSCVFTNVTTPRAHFPVHGVYAPTLIKEGASLGANSTIVCGHTVGPERLDSRRCRGDERCERLRPHGRRACPPDRMGMRMWRAARCFPRLQVRPEIQGRKRTIDSHK